MRFFGFSVMFIGLHMANMFVGIGQNSEVLVSKLCAFIFAFVFFVAAYSGFRHAVGDTY